MDSDFDKLLYYTQTQWLSKGKVVNRVYSLNDEICMCHQEQNMIEIAMTWEEHKFILGCSYLVDIFDVLTKLFF